MAKAAEAAKAASEQSSKARAEIERLNGELTRMQAALKAKEDQMKLAINAAKLEASQDAAESMLQRYRDGLRDGASLSRGSTVTLGSIAGSTPDSSGMGRPSPNSFAL